MAPVQADGEKPDEDIQGTGETEESGDGEMEKSRMVRVSGEGGGMTMLDGWTPFYAECRKHAEAALEFESTMRDAQERHLWAKWSLGVMVRDYGGNGRHDYGEQVVDRLAASLKADDIPGYDRSEIYACIRFARGFPDVPSVLEIIGLGYSWWGVKRNILPDKTERREKAIDDGMRSKEGIREAIKRGIPEEEKSGIVAFLEADISEAAELIAQIEPDREVAPIVVDHPQFRHDDHNKPSDYNAYTQWVCLNPCIVCGKDHTTTVMHPHHYPKTKGAGGDDRHQIPLCAVHHSEAHTMGASSFLAANGFDLIKWLQEQLYQAVMTNMKGE